MAVIYARSDEFHGRGLNLAVISIVFVIIAFALVACRLAARVSMGRDVGADDYVIVVSVIFSIGLTASNCASVDHGVGKHIKTLSTEQIHRALQAFWVAQLLYKFTINATKTSICLLYLRIFPEKRFRLAVYLVMSYVLLYALASIIATIVQCHPVERVWRHDIAGTCINLTAFWYANATANILGDVLILALPMPVIKTLNLPRRQRWGLVLVFALGGFVCITSILRMTTLKAGSKNMDTTYGTLSSTIWTTIEANTAIICACLPMLKSPLAALFPALFPRGSSAAYDCSSGSGQYHRRPSAGGANKWNRAPKIPRSTPGSSSPAKSSSEDHVEVQGGDVVLGTITKTTHVDVEVDAGAKECEASPPLPKRSPQRVRSISEAHLVGPESTF